MSEEDGYSFPGACSNGHPEVGHEYIGDGELCPVCQILSMVADARAAAGLVPGDGVSLVQQVAFMRARLRELERAE